MYSSMVLEETPQPLPKLDTSSHTTRTTSPVPKRIIRKPDQKSLPKLGRSFSEPKLQSSSMNLNKFYTKIKNTQATTVSRFARVKAPLVSNDQNISGDPEQQGHSPLIGKNKYVISEFSTSGILGKEMNDEYAQGMYQQLRLKNALTEKKLAICERELNKKMQQIEKLQRLLHEAIGRQKYATNKLQEYQKMNAEKQKDVSVCDTKGKMHKLKGLITQERKMELENKVDELTKENLRLKASNERSRVFEEQLKYKEIELKVQNQEQTKNILDQGLMSFDSTDLGDSKSTQRTQRQTMLQNLLSKRNLQKQSMASHISKLQIHINFLNRKREEEIQSINKANIKRTQKLRTRLLEFAYDQKSPPKKTGRRQQGGSTSQSFELQLSPENSQKQDQ